MLYYLALSTMLCGFWLINSGHYGPLMLGFMVVSVVFVVLLCRRMDVVDGESQPLSLTFTLPVYFVWLFKEVVLSNIAVARTIWQFGKPIAPVVITVIAHQKTDLGKVIYANSITLTPGTVSMDLQGDRILVHALARDTAESLVEGEMDRRVCRVEV
jgi:multicomponent Na+:H+ antiporter subunit E